jgi:GNAT-family acetyltransferase (TIGR03103 family)
MGELVLSWDGRRVTTLESLSELTTAVAFKRCHYKSHTRRVLEDAGLRVAPGRLATFDDADAAFLAERKDIVVKPDRGEGGQGLTVGVVDEDGLEAALAAARVVCPDVLLEQRCEGEDLRVIVIGGEVVAAAVRRPPTVRGDGQRTVAELVEELSRQRSQATGGAARVPLDEKTLHVVRAAGHEPDTILPEGISLPVRRTANVHTGGTIDDVTGQLHPELVAVSVAAARAIDIPVVGVDLMVPAVDGPEHTIIEANEQPGLANHEPQPTAQRFVDLLFPETASS